ncbi:hypothetical protein JCM30760_03850 [Thiomicrorhabdus hydrogeniphila]
MKQAQQQKIDTLHADANEKVVAAKSMAVSNLDLMVRDTLYISQSELLKKVLDSSVTSPSKVKKALNELAQDWTVLMESSPVYDQIRWIDSNGQERLRINHANGKVERVAEANLQNKSHRYYFSKTMKLKNDQFYFSPFDLNIENGVVETPRKPMIRLAKPVVDSFGHQRGVIVLNYLGGNMLKNIKQITSNTQRKLWVNNAQSYWLLGETAGDEWGFMYNQPTLTLAHRYPNAWSKINALEKGHFTDQNGMWHFDTINPVKESSRFNVKSKKSIVTDAVTLDANTAPNQKGSSSPYFWKIVYFTPKQDVVSLMRSARAPIYMGVFISFIVIVLGAFFLARARLAKELHTQELKETNEKLDKTLQKLEQENYDKELTKIELTESLERYTSVLSCSMDGFALMDRNGLILECNDAFYHVLHSTDNYLGGHTLGSIFSYEQDEKITNVITNLFTTGYRKLEVESNIGDAQYYIEISLMPVEATQQVCAFIRDITTQKESAFQLEMAASVFTHANEGIILTDENFLIIDANNEFELITRITHDEALGKKPSLLESSKHSEEFYTDLFEKLHSKDHWYGEVWSRRKTGELFLSFLTITRVNNPHGNSWHYVWMFNDITLEKQYQKRLQNSAHYDMLTNLPNRFLLNDRIQQAMKETRRNKHVLAIVFIDLDGFKKINDTYGHDMGDYLLVNIAKDMKSALRSTDTVARIGGDEFVAAVGGLHQADEAYPIINKLLNAIATPIEKGDITLQVSGSLGVTFYPQENNLDGEQLIRQADQAMYQAKQSGKNRYHVFDVDKDASNRDLIRNLNNIEQALLNDEFILHYQPKVSMHRDEVIGVEALIRWQHPQRGLLYPGDFLSCVEHTQLSIKMSEWVINKALTQIEQWEKQGIKLPISINIGVMELQKPNFVDWIVGLLEEHPTVEHSMIELEVLETSALEDVMSVKELITDCKSKGISFALDDFGTGFASLSYLKRLPIDTIKIDQSFICNMFDDPEDITLLEGMIGLTKSLNRKVVAEGIETEEHGCMLAELGCNYGQGYFIAKPMAPELMPKWLNSWHVPKCWKNRINETERKRA